MVPADHPHDIIQKAINIVMPEHEGHWETWVLSIVGAVIASLVVYYIIKRR